MSEYGEFKALVSRVLAVPAGTIKERVEEHRKQAKRNPKRRGPKQLTARTSASDRASREKD